MGNRTEGRVPNGEVSRDDHGRSFPSRQFAEPLSRRKTSLRINDPISFRRFRINVYENKVKVWDVRLGETFQGRSREEPCRSLLLRPGLTFQGRTVTVEERRLDSPFGGGRGSTHVPDLGAQPLGERRAQSSSDHETGRARSRKTRPTRTRGRRRGLLQDQSATQGSEGQT